MATQDHLRSPSEDFYHGLEIDRISHQIRVFEMDPLPSDQDVAPRKERKTRRTMRTRSSFVVTGKLRVIALGSRQLFDALSYVWGSKRENALETPYLIRCGDRELEVTANCVKALQHVRESFGGRVIWVDAICINQKDVDEKNHQVGLMGKIYRRASHVFAHIGDEDVKLADPKLPRSELNNLPPICFAKPGGGSWAIDELSKRTYFERGWTFQELVLARQPILVSQLGCMSFAMVFPQLTKIIPEAWGSGYPILTSDVQLLALMQLWMRIGHRELSHGAWSKCRDAFWNSQAFGAILVVLYSIWSLPIVFAPAMLPIYYMSYHYLHQRSPWCAKVHRFALATYRASQLIYKHWVLYRQRLEGDCAYRLFELLLLDQQMEYTSIVQALRHRKVQDPKDKAFALYGLLQDLGVRLTEPDYSRNLQRIYQNLFVDLLNWRATALMLLIDAGRPHSENGTYPTWIPQWQRDTAASWVPERIFNDENDVFDASRLIWNHGLLQFSVNGDELSVHGCYGDTIAKCLDFRTILECNNDNRDHSITLLSKIFKLMEDQTKEWGDIYMGDAAELFCLLLFNHELLSRHWETDLARASAWVERLHGNNAENLLDWETMMKNLTQNKSWTLKRIKADKRAAAFHTKFVESVCLKRTVFITSKGYIGAGPLWIQQEDVVYRVSGVPLPVVLRKTHQADKFAFLGPATLCGVGNNKPWPLVVGSTTFTTVTFI